MGIYFGKDRYAEDHVVFSSDFDSRYKSVRERVQNGTYSPEYDPALFPSYDRDPLDFEDMSGEERLNYTTGRLMTRQARREMDEDFAEIVERLSDLPGGSIIALANEEPGGGTRVLENIGSTPGECLKFFDFSRQMMAAVTELDEFACAVRSKEDPNVASVYTFRVMKDGASPMIARKIEKAYWNANGSLEDPGFGALLDRYTKPVGPTVRELYGWEEPERAKEFRREKEEALSAAVPIKTPGISEFSTAMKNGETIDMGDGILYKGYMVSQEFSGYMTDIAASADGRQFIQAGFIDLRSGIIYSDIGDIGGKKAFGFTGIGGYRLESFTRTKDAVIFRISDSIVRAGINLLKQDGISIERGWSQTDDEKPYYDEARSAWVNSGGRMDAVARYTGIFKNEGFMKRLDAENVTSMTKRYLIDPNGFISACVNGAIAADRDQVRKDGAFRMADLNSYQIFQAERSRSRGL